MHFLPFPLPLLPAAVIMNLDNAVANPLDKSLWFDNSTEQALKLSLGGIANHPGLLAIAYSTEGTMMYRIPALTFSKFSRTLMGGRGVTSFDYYLQIQ